MSKGRWTQEEIEEYASRREKDIGLRMSYDLANIPANEPWKRIQHLIQKLKIPHEDLPLIQKHLKNGGKVETLLKLEETYPEYY